MRIADAKDSFNAGEFSPLVAARVRFDKYKNGLTLCENMIPLVQGGITRRPGTMHVAEVKNSAKSTRLVRFEFSITQAYIIEFGDLYCRFYKDRGQIVTAPSTPYEIVTTYAEAHLFDLKFTQSADVQYITHPSYPPAKLSRSAHTSWTLGNITFLDGPYLSTNSTATTITPSATTGTITLTASASLFTANDVGRLVRLKHSTTWGYARITVYTSATVVTATVVNAFGDIAATASWRLGLFYIGNYPTCVTFFEDRLCFGVGQTIAMSKSGDYENFAPTATDGTVTADNGMTMTLNSAEVNQIIWINGDEKGLLVGTNAAEWIVRATSFGEALTPTNISAKGSTWVGSDNLQAVRANKSTLFINRTGKELHELAYVYEVDGFRTPDLSVLSSHILGGVKQFAYQQNPNSVVWFAQSDLAGFTFMRDQDVLGWHRHILGGAFGSSVPVVESVAVIPTPDISADEVWLIVNRTINGTTKKYIEYITEFFDGDTADTAFFVDSGLTYSGAPADTISGLGHLEGQTVSVLADGSVHPDVVVTSGAITLSREASLIHIGLAYTSTIKTLRIDVGAADGTSQGKTKRIHHVTVRLYKSLGLDYGREGEALSSLPFRSSADLMGDPPALFTGDKQIDWPSGYDTDGLMVFSQTQPLPFTLLGVFPQLATYDR